MEYDPLIEEPDRDQAQTLTVATWNVWMESTCQRERMTAIAHQLIARQPHVIGLQELTATHDLDLYKILGRAGYIRAASAVSSGFIAHYWEGLYFRWDVARDIEELIVERHPYEETRYGRGVTALYSPTFDCVIGTTHLESMNFPETRMVQLREAIRFCEGRSPASHKGSSNPLPQASRHVLMGDFNLFLSQDADLPSGWFDAWLTLHPDDPGLTYDPVRNGMIDDHLRDRVDRICYSAQGLRPVSMEMLGLEPLENALRPGESRGEVGRRPVFPSDHFGLVATFELVAPPPSSQPTDLLPLS